MIEATTHRHGPACSHAPPAPTPPPPSSAARLARRGSASSLLAVLAGVTTWVYLRNPMEHTVFPPCPFRLATGLWCPGCGATRASFLLLKGHPLEALHHNALWVVLAPFALWQAVTFFAAAYLPDQSPLRSRLRPVPIGRPLGTVLLVAMGAFFIVRNLPIDALHVLNPRTTS